MAKQNNPTLAEILGNEPRQHMTSIVIPQTGNNEHELSVVCELFAETFGESYCENITQTVITRNEPKYSSFVRVTSYYDNSGYTVQNLRRIVKFAQAIGLLNRMRTVTIIVDYVVFNVPVNANLG